jgi:K+-dependent Na+/Ca+ exchanger-like protein
MNIIVSAVILLICFYIISEIVDGPFIKSLDNISKWLKLPQSVAGATLLSMGTSAPEISTALIALFLEGANPGTGVGTIVGSAIFQILVVIGFAALVKTSYLDWRPVIRDSIFYAFSVFLLIVFVQDNRFTMSEALILVGSYVGYLVVLLFWTKYVKEEEVDVPVEEEKAIKETTNPLVKVWRTVTFPIKKIIDLIPDVEKNQKWTVPVFILSLIIIGYACYWLVVASEAFAETLGIPSVIIALTILAGGSSVPEMISSAVVSKQGRGDMAIANAIGSNIFDILISLGLPVLIFTSMQGDLENLGGANINSSIILLFFTLIMVISLLAAQKFKATRAFGAFLIFLYVLYVIAAYAGWIGS